MYTLDEYQKQAHSTAIYDKGIAKFNQDQLYTLATLSYALHGLCGESGECAEKLKKFYRSGGCDDVEANWRELSDDLSKELGDVLWYISEAAGILGFSLDDIARQNLEKLRSRQERGVLHGSGDQR